jgi:hypothetical protein
MRVGEDVIPYLSTTPQPIALAVGRVARASGQAERLEACLKAAEVLARYLAVVGMASAAATREHSLPPPRIEEFTGNLSFGHFEKAMRVSYATSWDHPLRELLRSCLKSTKKNKPVAGLRLESLVRLRNTLGHALTPADEPRARAIFAEEDPIGALIDIITGVEPILDLPVAVVLNQQHRKGKIQARLAFYVGEGEPIPRDVILGCGAYEWEAPYLCTEDGLIPLSAGLFVHPQPNGRFGLYLIDGIDADEARYKSVYDNTTYETGRTIPDLARWLELPFPVAPASLSTAPLIEDIRSEDGRTLLGFIRGDFAPSPEPATAESLVQANNSGVAHDALTSIPSLGDFESQANLVGLGSAFRDVIYLLLEFGHKAEVSEGGVRVVSGSEANRVLLTAQLQPGPVLAITILPGAFFQDARQDNVVLALKPNQPADDVLGLLTSLAMQKQSLSAGSAVG